MAALATALAVLPAAATAPPTAGTASPPGTGIGLVVTVDAAVLTRGSPADPPLVLEGTAACSTPTPLSFEGTLFQTRGRHVTSGRFDGYVECTPTPTSWTAVVWPSEGRFLPLMSSVEIAGGDSVVTTAVRVTRR